jgi:hypothetical protein
MKHILFLVGTILANHGALQSCFSCKAKSEDKYFCKWGGLLGNGMVACCDAESVGDAYCTPGLNNKCSPKYSEVQESFYDYCPGAFNTTVCGDYSKSANLNKQTFKFGGVFNKDGMDSI